MNESIEIRKVNTTDTHLFNQIVQIRKTVFVEEQNVSPEEEFDEFEEGWSDYANGQPVERAPRPSGVQ